MLNENRQRNINLNKLQILFPAVPRCIRHIHLTQNMCVIQVRKTRNTKGIAETAGTELTVNDNCNKGISNYAQISIPYDRTASAVPVEKITKVQRG